MGAFEQYVLTRGLIEPGIDHRQAIFSENELLAELGDMWRGHKVALEKLIKARIYTIEQELVAQATPYEVPFLRQSMVDVAFILDDLEAYAAEYDRRKKDGIGQPGGGDSPPAPDTGQSVVEDNGAEESSM